MFYFRLICVLRPSVSASKLSSPACHSPRGFLRNPHSLPRASCANLLRPSVSASKPKSLRRDGDSNPGNPFGVYTLSRRASSTTRASLHCVRRQIASPHNPKNELFQGTHKGDFSKSATKLLQIIHIRKFFGNYFLFCYIFSSIICIYQKKTLPLHPE